MSVIHSNGEVNYIFIIAILLSIYSLYINLYIDSIFYLSLAICIKILIQYIEIDNHLSDMRYEKWIQYKKKSHIRNILTYSDYIFYPLSLIILCIISYGFISHINDDYIPKVLNLSMSIMYMYVISLYYSLSLTIR